MATSSKWTYETCYEEAKKYNSRNEFKHGCGSAYKKARKEKWIGDYTWFEEKHKPSGYWENYDHCYEEAKKYKSRGEFANKKHVIYNIARKNGWLDDYTWFEEIKRTWTYDECYSEAKKYTSKSEFKSKNQSAFSFAYRNKWIKDYTWLKRPVNWNFKWTKDKCHEEAKKYKSRSEFMIGSSGAYAAAKDNLWLDDYVWFEEKQKPSGYWNYEKCYEEALKYKTRADFKKGSCTAYNNSNKNGWIESFTWLEYVQMPREYRFNLLKEFIDEYELRAFLENNDENILYIILRNVEPKYEPLVDEVEKIIRNSNGNDPMKALINKYSQDETAEDVNKDNETYNETHEEIHGINEVDLDDDEAVKEAFKQEEEKKEVSIDDVVKNTEKELEVINKIEHLLTPEDREYIMDKFLNDKLREYMAKKDAQK